MRHIIERLTTPPVGVSATELARRAHVNRSTIHRIATGETDPSLGTLRELAIAQGLDLDICLRPLSDGDASAAARVLLDRAFAEHRTTEAESRWVSRLEPLTDPIDLVTAAGHASAPAYRRGAVLLRGDRSALRLASAGAASGGSWALSGAAALAVMTPDEPVAGASILWCDDPESAGRMLADTHTRVTSPENAHVVIAPATDSVFIDAWSDGAIHFVAPVQALIDCIGLGGSLEHAAQQIAEGWSSR